MIDSKKHINLPFDLIYHNSIIPEYISSKADFRFDMYKLVICNYEFPTFFTNRYWAFEKSIVFEEYISLPDTQTRKENICKGLVIIDVYNHSYSRCSKVIGGSFNVLRITEDTLIYEKAVRGTIHEYEVSWCDLKFAKLDAYE